MKWRVEETKDGRLIRDLYRGVFDNELTTEAITNKCQDGNPTWLVLRNEENAACGFGFLVGWPAIGEVEFWLGGILPRFRRMGGMRHLLEEVENRFATDYQRLTVSTYNRWNITLSMLTRRGYEVVGTDYSEERKDLRIRLAHSLRPRKELRVSLTERCNFHCFFCHGEGLDKATVRTTASEQQFLDVLKQAADQGYDDLTFTGGEPLLEKKRLLRLLDALAKFRSPPTVTVVTNGYLLDDEAIRTFAHYATGTKRFKLHVSLHGTNEEAFNEATRCEDVDGAFARVLKNIRAATTAGLEVKLNCVVLRRINHDSIAEASELARSLGVRVIKLLELLATPETQNLFEHYVVFESICERVAKIAHEHKRSPRSVIFKHNEDQNFRIEVQRLTCHLGCSRCHGVRDRTLSSDLRYHPCFARSTESFPIDDGNDLPSAFRDGDKIIQDNAAKHGFSSPSLACHESYNASKSEYCFELDDPDALADFLVKKDFVHCKSDRFVYIYYRPIRHGDDWARFERILGLGWDCRSEKPEIIYQNVQYREDPAGGLCSRTEFLFDDGPLRLPTKEKARRLLKSFDFAPISDEIEFSIRIFAREALELRVGTANGRHTVVVRTDEEGIREVRQILRGYSGRLTPLTKPLAAFTLGQ